MGGSGIVLHANTYSGDRLADSKTGQWDEPLAETLITAGRIAFSVALLVVCAALLVGATNNAFIYTRF